MFPNPTWTVHVTFIALPGENTPASATVTHPDQATAEHQALHLACCAGARYITVECPAHIVTLEWDRYTNMARRYGRPIGTCGNKSEPEGRTCTTNLYAHPCALQVKCPGCGAWTGVLSPGRPRFPRNQFTRSDADRPPTNRRWFRCRHCTQLFVGGPVKEQPVTDERDACMAHEASCSAKH